jgi:hypothetical protein
MLVILSIAFESCKFLGAEVNRRGRHCDYCVSEENLASCHPKNKDRWLHPSHSRFAKTRNCVTSAQLLVQEDLCYHTHSLSKFNSTIRFDLYFFLFYPLATIISLAGAKTQSA